jgi:hypothetical protein
MPTYKVVDVLPKVPGTASAHVTAEDIEQALNEQGRDGWSLMNILEHFSPRSYAWQSTVRYPRLQEVAGSASLTTPPTTGFALESHRRDPGQPPSPTNLPDHRP